jgi:hypothetical protein
MKYWLKDFEHNISPTTWETADQLCQSGSVRNLREIETHFWVSRVDVEEGSFETEVIITPHKIKAYSCECFTPGRRLMCVHIAASLLKIRQFLDQRAEERRLKAEAAQSNEMSRITVQSVLENATEAEVEAFVRDYARRDRDFALALKTWFAGSVTESENPYALVLDSVFPKTTPAKGYRDPDFRRVRKALDGLEVQLNIAASDGNYRGMFQISAAILMKTLPALEKTEGTRHEALLHFCKLGLQKITEISDRNLSVELRESAWELVFDLGARAFFPAEMHRQAILFLSESAKDAEKAERIRLLFDSTPHPAPAFLLELYLASLSVRKMPEAAPKVLEDFIEMPDVVRSAILQLYYLKHWDAVLQTGTYFLSKQIFSPKHQREVEDVLLFVVEQMGDKVRQVDLLRQRFMKSGNFETFRKLKEVADKNWPKVRAKMVEELSARGEINILAAALAAEGQLDELAQLIENEGTIALVQRYESYFFIERSDFLRERYVTLMSAYLDDHFGAPAATHVRHKLAELAQKGNPELVLQIARELLLRYPDRTALPEELAELLPKSKRKALLST